MSYMSASQKKSPWLAMIGLMKCLVGLAVIWPGAISLMVGMVYYLQRGSWVPILTGSLMVLLGFLILIRGVRQILKNLTEMYDEDDV